MNIKNIYLLVFCASFFLAACGNQFVVEDNFDLDSLGGYVAFDAPGNTITNEDIVTTENGGLQNLLVESPTGTASDITVTYEFGGDAIFGEDFTVDGASASGGTIILTPRETDVLNRARVNIPVQILTDDEYDGTKTLTVTLTSASNAEGDLDVGRGTSGLLTTRTIVMTDCDVDLVGNYTATTAYSSHDSIDVYTADTIDLSLVETTFGVFSTTDISGGLYSVGPYADALGTTGFPFEFTQDCGAITWDAQMDPTGTQDVVNGGSSYDAATGVITISISLSVNMEAWVITLTPK